MGTRVFVGGLTYKIRERDLEKFFRKYGRIKEVSMKNGYAFVEFDDYRDADDAVYEMNGKELLGDRVTVERARGTPRGSDQWRGSGGGGGGGGGGRDRGYGAPRRSNDNQRGRDKYGPPTRTEYRVVVKNLSSRVSWQDLKDYMRKAGEVTYADAHKQGMNEGVVEFASYSDMKNAIETLDNTEINGRTIRVVEDKSRGAKRSRSSSNSRSRSRSRRRSRSPRSRSQSRSRSKSKSAAHSKSRSKSRSKDPSRSHSRSRSKSRSHSKGDDAQQKRSHSRSVSADRS